MMLQKLLVADDHPLLVSGLQTLLGEMPEIELLDPVDNGRYLLTRLRQCPADIVLLDLHMPQLDGIEALKIIRTEFPRTKVLVFTNYNNSKILQKVRALGARGYLLKNSTAPTLREAIQTIIAGGEWFPAIPQASAPSDFFTDDFMKKYQVTAREVEIIRKIAQGFTTREIGEQLFISEFTINAHRRNICRKLDIYTPVGLVNFAKEHGLA
jgi:two-component system NarL family response regulator